MHLTASYLSAVRGSEADLIEDVTIPTGLVHDKFVPRVPVIEDDTYTQTDTNLDSNLAQNPQTRKMLEHSIDELTPKTIGEEEEELVIHQRMQNMVCNSREFLLLVVNSRCVDHDPISSVWFKIDSRDRST